MSPSSKLVCLQASFRPWYGLGGIEEDLFNELGRWYVEVRDTFLCIDSNRCSVT